MEETGIASLIEKTKNNMKSHSKQLQSDLMTLRTGRASPQLIENIKVEHYETLMPIKQLGAISVPDAKTIEITPWDITALETIEKALQKADLGCNPVNDGKLIRISLPQMTEERRKTLAKNIKAMSEDCKVKIRQERRDTIEKIKKAEKRKEISQDDCKRFETEIQKLTDNSIEEIDKILSEKEKEIMSV
jgi:ribosome recycling factor